jgi:hypothetical protein
MATTITFTLTVPSVQGTVAGKMRVMNGFSPQSFMEIGKYFEAISGGAYNGRVVTTIGSLPAVTSYVGY